MKILKCGHCGYSGNGFSETILCEMTAPVDKRGKQMEMYEMGECMGESSYYCPNCETDTPAKQALVEDGVMEAAIWTSIDAHGSNLRELADSAKRAADMEDAGRELRFNTEVREEDDGFVRVLIGGTATEARVAAAYVKSKYGHEGFSADATSAGAAAILESSSLIANVEIEDKI